jgi:hypothetical protein
LRFKQRVFIRPLALLAGTEEQKILFAFWNLRITDDHVARQLSWCGAAETSLALQGWYPTEFSPSGAIASYSRFRIDLHEKLGLFREENA